MALKIDGISPTEIKYGDTDLTVLEYFATIIPESPPSAFSVWGKPYSLSITTDDNVTVTVNRNSSPNEHANTGTLADGNIVYHGDVIRITATPKTGYTLETLTVNGSTFNSGYNMSVASSITIVAKASSGAWQIVYTGSSSASNNTTSTVTKVLSPTIKIPNNATKIRVTGSYKLSGKTTSFSNKEIELTDTTTTYTIAGLGSIKLIITKGANLSASLTKGSFIQSTQITITNLRAFVE